MRIRYGGAPSCSAAMPNAPSSGACSRKTKSRRTDVLKVGHHGSRTSSAEEFLDAAAPEFAIISAGPDNSYGHPNRDVLDRLREHHAAVYRTDQDGLITVRTDGKRLWVETGRSASAGLLSPIFQ